MKKIIIVIMSVVVLMACDNKSHQTESVVFDNQADVEQTKPDTVASSKQKEMPTVEEKQSKPISSSSASSSRSHKSSSYDNMRGFDPASEDDMDDNGMSRYMENNDEEGWD